MFRKNAMIFPHRVSQYNRKRSDPVVCVPILESSESENLMQKKILECTDFSSERCSGDQRSPRRHPRTACVLTVQSPQIFRIRGEMRSRRATAS